MDKRAVTELIKLILEKQGKEVPELGDEVLLRTINFRSLDFSELCLRVEQQIGRELNFEYCSARLMVGQDVCEFIATALTQ